MSTMDDGAPNEEGWNQAGGTGAAETNDSTINMNNQVTGTMGWKEGSDTRPDSWKGQGTTLSSPVRAKTMTRASYKKAVARKAVQMGNSPRSGYGRVRSPGRGRGRGRGRARVLTPPSRNLTGAFASMASAAGEIIFGSANGVEIKKEIIQNNEPYMMTKGQVEDADSDIELIGVERPRTIPENKEEIVIESEDEDNDGTSVDEDTKMRGDDSDDGKEEMSLSSEDDASSKQNAEVLVMENDEEKQATPKQGIQNPYKKHKKHLEIVTVFDDTVDGMNDKQDNDTNEGSPTPKSKGTAQVDEGDSTPKSNGSKTYAKAVGQTQIKTHEQLKLNYSMYAEIGFTVERHCQDLPQPVADAIIREVLMNILKRGKYVDRKFALNPYFEGTNLPTLRKPEEVPLGTQQLRAYFPHQYNRAAKL